MSNAEPNRQEQVVAYLVRALQRNPLEEGELIVQQRSRLLGLEKKIAPAQRETSGEDVQARRTRLLAQLEKLRGSFWTAPLPELRTALERIDAGGFADVQLALYRLRTVAAHRHELPALSQHRDFDGQFFACLKEVLVSPPREVAVLKERVLASFSGSKQRKRGRRMIKLIKKELPALYDLEADWLESLMRQKTTILASRSERGTTAAADESGGIPWWVWWLLIVLVARVLRALAE